MDDNQPTNQVEPTEVERIALVRKTLEDTLRAMRQLRPMDRSEKARRWAVAITEMEKVFAYFETFVFCEGI